MSERLQKTASSTREKMLQRYGTVPHKHCKHIARCYHQPSHPSINKSIDEILGEQESHCSTGIIREYRVKKYRRGVAVKSIH